MYIMRLSERKRKTQKKRLKKTQKKIHRNRMKKTQNGGFRRLVSSTDNGPMPKISGIGRWNQYSISSTGNPSGLPNHPEISGGVNNGNNHTYLMHGGDVRDSLIPVPLLMPLRNVSYGLGNIYNGFFGNLPGVNPNPWMQPI
jgi:hypothetical protein